MELRAVRCFVAVAEAGTVTAGAAVLGVGQPAVTRQIQQLERQLRVSLFDREDGRLRLTSAGRHVLPFAQQLLRQADDVTAAAKGVASGGLEFVRMVSTGTTRDDVLAPWLASWGPDAPMPAIVEADVDGLFTALRRRADFAVAPVAAPPGLASRVVADLGVWAQVAPDHPWANRGSVGLDEVAEADLLLLERNFHARRRFDSALDGAGLGLASVAEFASPVVAQAVAASGRGVCVVTDDARFDLVTLPILDRGRRLDIRLRAAWEPTHHAATQLAELAEQLRDFTRRRYADGASCDGASSTAE